MLFTESGEPSAQVILSYISGHDKVKVKMFDLILVLPDLVSGLFSVKEEMVVLGLMLIGSTFPLLWGCCCWDFRRFLIIKGCWSVTTLVMGMTWHPWHLILKFNWHPSG